MAFKEILVPLDGSTFAESILQYIRQIAEPGARVRLLSVVPDHRLSEIVSVANSVEIAFTSAPAVAPAALPTTDESADEMKTYLNRIAGVIESAGMVPVIEVMHGNVTEAISSAAAQGADVIVMATHGRGGLRRLIFGSVTDEVIRAVEIPVLIVPSPAEPVST